MTDTVIEFECPNCGETLPPKRIKFKTGLILVVCKECEYAMRFEH